MLRVEKTVLGKFGEPELAVLINSRGWKSVLPDALDDQHLLLISDQLRDLLAGKGWDVNFLLIGALLALVLLGSGAWSLYGW